MPRSLFNPGTGTGPSDEIEMDEFERFHLSMGVVQLHRPTTDETANTQRVLSGNGSIGNRFVVQHPYTIFTNYERNLIVLMVSCAGFLSPLAANVYYPGFPEIAKDLNVSNTAVNLTVTAFLILQGFAPMVISPISDQYGRRNPLVLCLLMGLGANIALSLIENYPALVVLRCLQAVGTSTLNTIGIGAITDVTTSSERGKFVSYASLGVLSGPALGPIIGGLLVQYQGWHSTFVLLAALNGIVLYVFFVYFPETNRSIVGNGSIIPRWYNRSFSSYWERRRLTFPRDDPVEGRNNGKLRNFFKELGTVLKDKFTWTIVTYTAIQFAGYYIVLSALPTQMVLHYKFNSLQIGLTYIPIGVGSVVAAVICSRLLDRRFKLYAARGNVRITPNQPPEIRYINVERARLEICVVASLFAALFTIGFGWALHFKTNLAVPLVLLFFLGFFMSTSFQPVQLLIQDWNGDRAASSSSVYNGVRCAYAAAGTGFTIPMLNKIGVGWSGTIVGISFLVFAPIPIVLMLKGFDWRVVRANKLLARSQKAPGHTYVGCEDPGTRRRSRGWYRSTARP